MCFACSLEKFSLIFPLLFAYFCFQFFASLQPGFFRFEVKQREKPFFASKHIQYLALKIHFVPTYFADYNRIDYHRMDSYNKAVNRGDKRTRRVRNKFSLNLKGLVAIAVRKKGSQRTSPRSSFPRPPPRRERALDRCSRLETPPPPSALHISFLLLATHRTLKNEKCKVKKITVLTTQKYV
jgi:hypothetical protein